MTPPTVDTDYLESVLRDAIVTLPTPELVGRVGAPDWLDLRGVLLDPLNARFLASLLLPNLKPFLNDAFSIGGVGYDGLLLALEMRSQLDEHAPFAQVSYFGIAPALLDREAPFRVFGSISPTAILVTGVVHTGRTVEAAKRLVEIHRGAVRKVLAVVDRRAQSQRDVASIWSWDQIKG